MLVALRISLSLANYQQGLGYAKLVSSKGMLIWYPMQCMSRNEFYANALKAWSWYSIINVVQICRLQALPAARYTLPTCTWLRYVHKNFFYTILVPVYYNGQDQRHSHVGPTHKPTHKLCLIAGKALHFNHSLVGACWTAVSTIHQYPDQ